MINQLGFYLKANGTVCKMEEIGLDENYDGCYDDVGDNYYSTGEYYKGRQTSRDIIAHIPTALQFEILRIIEAYHTTDSFKTMIDNCYKNHLEKKEN